MGRGRGRKRKNCQPKKKAQKKAKPPTVTTEEPRPGPSSAMRFPSQVYRNHPIGKIFKEALEEWCAEYDHGSHVTEALMMAYDRAMADCLATTPNKVAFGAEKIVDYRVVDGEVTLILKNTEFRNTQHMCKTKWLKMTLAPDPTVRAQLQLEDK